MPRKLSAIAIAALVACAGVQVAIPAEAKNTLTPDQAPEHIGETATVCGVVVSIRFASGTKGQHGQHAFLDLDLPYPHQVFTVIIWVIGTPEITPMGQMVCATGTIQTYRGKAEIIATDPRQLVA